MGRGPNEEKGKEKDPRIQSAAVSLDVLFQLQLTGYFYFISRENVKRKTMTDEIQVYLDTTYSVEN